MIRHNYPDWFQDLWNQCSQLRTRPKLGNKSESFKECKKLQIGAEDVEFLVKCFKNHNDTIREFERTGQFIAACTDFERWIKRRTWENWEDGQENPRAVDAPSRPLSRAEECREEISRLFDSGEDGAPSGSGYRDSQLRIVK